MKNIKKEAHKEKQRILGEKKIKKNRKNTKKCSISLQVVTKTHFYK